MKEIERKIKEASKWSLMTKDSKNESKEEKEWMTKLRKRKNR